MMNLQKSTKPLRHHMIYMSLMMIGAVSVRAQDLTAYDDNFGIPDFSHMLNGYTAPDVGSILKQLHLQTKKYETRLQAVRVTYVEQNKFPGKLQFQISAEIKIKEQAIPFSVNALLSDDGSVNLNA